MPDKSGMNYQTMREMNKGFKEARNSFKIRCRRSRSWGRIWKAARSGQAGQTFQGALNGPLTKALQKLSDKMGELAGDVEGARAYYEDGVKNAQSRFK